MQHMLCVAACFIAKLGAAQPCCRVAEAAVAAPLGCLDRFTRGSTLILRLLQSSQAKEVTG